MTKAVGSDPPAPPPTTQDKAGTQGRCVRGCPAAAAADAGWGAESLANFSAAAGGGRQVFSLAEPLDLGGLRLAVFSQCSPGLRARPSPRKQSFAPRYHSVVTSVATGH